MIVMLIDNSTFDIKEYENIGEYIKFTTNTGYPEEYKDPWTSILYIRKNNVD